MDLPLLLWPNLSLTGLEMGSTFISASSTRTRTTFLMMALRKVQMRCSGVSVVCFKYETIHISFRTTFEFISAFISKPARPINLTWGYENRTAAIRIPGGKQSNRRIEHRVAGADTNIYLVLAAILGAALDGLENCTEAPNLFPVTVLMTLSRKECTSHNLV